MEWKMSEIIWRRKTLQSGAMDPFHTASTKSFEEIGKLTLIQCMKKVVFLCKHLLNNHLLRIVFEVPWKERIYKHFCIVLSSKTRRSSINLIFTGLQKILVSLTYHPYVLLGKNAQNNGKDFLLLLSIIENINDNSFWGDINRTIILFDLICKCFGLTEAYYSTFSTVYTHFLFEYSYQLSGIPVFWTESGVGWPCCATLDQIVLFVHLAFQSFFFVQRCSKTFLMKLWPFLWH